MSWRWEVSISLQVLSFGECEVLSSIASRLAYVVLRRFSVGYRCLGGMLITSESDLSPAERALLVFFLEVEFFRQPYDASQAFASRCISSRLAGSFVLLYCSSHI